MGTHSRICSREGSIPEMDRTGGGTVIAIATNGKRSMRPAKSHTEIAADHPTKPDGSSTLTSPDGGPSG